LKITAHKHYPSSAHTPYIAQTTSEEALFAKNGSVVCAISNKKKQRK